MVALVVAGYVGFPLTVEFGNKFPTIGFCLSETMFENYCCQTGLSNVKVWRL